jgi:hypothetical protein
LELDDEARPSTQTYGRNQQKNSSNCEIENQVKISLKIMKMKNIVAQDRR